VEERGGTPWVFPVLEISFSTPAEIQSLLGDVKAEDVLVFVSMNAVYAVLNDIAPALRQQLSKAQIAAVGARTRQVLLESGMDVPIQAPQDQQNSEGLLQHPGLQKLLGRRVFIIRAQSGRDTLREVLEQRGAEVHYIRAYQRHAPQGVDPQPILEALSNKAINQVMLTSHDAFLNLLQMLGKSAPALLKGVVLVVPSARVADKISAAYPFSIHVAENASDKAMLNACLI